MKQFDAIIIGFGKGGKTLAADLAAAGKTVAMIEKSPQMYGGTCINVGCIPTKSLVTSAKRAEWRQPADFSAKAKLYAEAIAEKARLTGMLRQKNYAKLADHPNISVYTGTGSFLSPKTVQVKTAGETMELQSDRIFINTGSAPFLPPIPGIENNPRVFTSETLLDLNALPSRLAIIGGGYIGLEFASFFAGFGAKVTVLQDGETFLPREDSDIAAEIQNILEAKGVCVLTGVQTKAIQSNAAAAVISYERGKAPHTLEAEAVLIATGRRPNIKELNLPAAGIETTPRGAVKTDEYLRATAPGVWAMGDVAGGLLFTYVSLDDYRIVKAQLPEFQEKPAFQAHTTQTRANIPYSVFIDPPFSRIGLNEKEALARGHKIKVAKLAAAAIPKAQVLKETSGFLKAVIDDDTKEILGMMLLCAESHEMINIVKVAMDAKLPYTYLKDQIFTHPTMSEAFNDLLSGL